MCLIVVKPAGIELPKEEHLRNGAKRNSDGLGLAYLKEGETTVHLKKDFKGANELIDFLNATITKEDALVVHFRLATHGLKDEGNRHPFPVCKNKELLRKTELDCKYIAAHNGVLGQYSRSDSTDLSDSQRFILDILSETSVKENLDKPGIKLLVNDFLNGDRLAVLNNKGKLWMFGDFTEDEGCHYSNTYYKTYRNYSTGFHGAYQRGFGNHWGDYDPHLLENQNKPNRRTSSKNEKPVKNEDNVDMKGPCEGCGKTKKLKFQTYKTQEYCLCKKCRKKARKDKLVITNIIDEAKILSQENNEEINIFPCVSCRTCYPADELELMWDAYSVCKICLDQMKQDENQALLVS